MIQPRSSHVYYMLQGPTVLTRPWGPLAQGREVLEQLRSLVEQGRLQPVLDRVFPVSDVELAFQHASSSNAVGKTVVHFR
jgi:NADPH:quinone reductase-like Zn-dependent oxidoreductase